MMHQWILLVILLALIFFSQCAKDIQEIPSFLKICHRNDPHLNECIKRSIESLRPFLRSGISAFHVPPCEPLTIPGIDMSQTSGPVAMKSTYSNIIINGGTKFSVRSVKVDVNNDRIRSKLFIPRLSMTSDYNINGKILMLPIIGHGKAQGNFTDVNVIMMIQGEQYQNSKTKKKHFRVVQFDVDLDVAHANVHLDNLFDGDKTLADGMNTFLNENWKMIAAEMKPAIEDALSKLFKEFSNKIYSKYPLDVLLPP